MSRITEHPFDDDADHGKRAVMTEYAKVAGETTEDDETRRKQLSDPAVRERLRAISEEARKGEAGPRITAEELPEFLHEHGH